MAATRRALRKRQNGHSEVISEIIGRQAATFDYYRLRGTLNIDRTVPAYDFWDNLRRGKAVGYELGGLFCKPIVEIISAHVLGRGFTPRLTDTDDLPPERVDYTNDLLSRFANRYLGLFYTMLNDLYALGDQFVIINANGSLSVPSPDMVTAEYDPLDYRKLSRVVVTSRFEKFEVTDEYTTQRRVLRIKWLASDGQYRAGHVEEMTFSNLIGRIPIVHFANDRSGNETHGRPIYEALLRLLSRYDDLLEKSLDGAELMGNPIPVISGLEDTQQTHELNEPIEPETYTDIDGNEEERDIFNFDTRAGLLLRGDAQFKFEAPPSGFTEDTRNMLQLLFLLQLDHTRVPEAVWGGAIESSKASAEAQMPPFYQFVEGRRLALEGGSADESLGTEAESGFHALFDIWLRMRSLTDKQIVTAPVLIDWDDLEKTPPEIKFQWVSWLRQMGLLSRETALVASGIVENVEAELAAVEEEAENAKKEDPFDEQLMASVKNAIAQLGTPQGQNGDQAQQSAAQDDQQSAGQAERDNQRAADDNDDDMESNER